MSSNIFSSCYLDEQKFKTREREYEAEIEEMDELLHKCRRLPLEKGGNPIACNLIQKELDVRVYGLQQRRLEFYECGQLNSMILILKQKYLILINMIKLYHLMKSILKVFF